MICELLKESGPSQQETDASNTSKDTGDNVTSNLKHTENIGKYEIECSVFVEICSFTGLMMCYNVIMILMPAFKLAMKSTVCRPLGLADVSKQCCRYLSPYEGRCPCWRYWQFWKHYKNIVMWFSLIRLKSHSSNLNNKHLGYTTDLLWCSSKRLSGGIFSLRQSK